MADPRYPDPRDAAFAAASELILTDGQYGLLRDNTKGVIFSVVGPTVLQLSGRQETPVEFDVNSRTYKEVAVDKAVKTFITARRNEYVELQNPSVKGMHPNTGSKQAPVDLSIGEVEVVPGPVSFALYAGQAASVIAGHRLRSNEFLLIEVVDEDAATKNWKSAVMKVAEPSTSVSTGTQLTTTDGTPDPDAVPTELVQPPSVSFEVPADLSVGQQYLVKGTDVRFYIPPTGVRVMQDENGSYVRQALTLEIMEYCILVDENGTKTFPRGPAVVFPNPTQKFITSENGGRSFRPIELNPIQGLHLKALADHTFMGKKITEGTEFFITGKQVQIYYPNPAHAQVKYDGQAKSFATSVPKGESRYVLDRNTGVVELVLGPVMLLPNPVEKVLVRRVLTATESELWYPGNVEAAQYNIALREQAAQTPTTRTGTVSEGQMARARGLPAGTRGSSGMESSQLSNSQNYAKGEEIDRHSTYNAPRTITLDSKYAGSPVIQPWPGFAVLVVGKDGNRKVVQGPDRVHLEYDETLQPFSFSTGRPKSGKNRKRDVYLRASNNGVRDEIEVLTADHVRLNVYLSLRVGFTGTTQDEMQKWWSIEDYVKFLTDNVRSRMKSEIRKLGFSEFYSKSADIIRNIILGEIQGEGEDAKRKGLFFAENNLRVFDVEVLEVNIADTLIRQQLDEAMRKTVVSELTLSQDRVRITNLTEQAKLHEAEINLKDGMLSREAALALSTMDRNATNAEKAREIAAEKQAADIEFRERQDEAESTSHEARLAREKASENQRLAAQAAEQELEKAMLLAQTTATVERYKAVEGSLTTALVAISDKRTLVDLADATSLQRFVGGKNVAEAFTQIFGENIGTAIAGVAHRAFETTKIDRGTRPTNGQA